MRAMQNPQSLLNFISTQGRAMQDPRMQRAMELIQTNDIEGQKRMAENLCKQYGITTEEAKNRIFSLLGNNGNKGP